MKKGINVLSLFDGMSCGRIALERAGIEIDNYYASEIDKYAMQVSEKNYPDIKQLGSVIGLTEEDLLELGEIDMLIGGSPCQGFSVAGKMKGSQTKEGVDVTSLEQYLDLKNRGFEFDGQSYLFWEYVRVCKIVKPKYFFLENVRVTKKWLPMFNEAMGVEPIIINSRLVSAQNRIRYYWTNISGIIQPEDKGILLKDILEEEVGEIFNAGENLQKGYKGGNQLNPNYKSQANTIHEGDKSGTICAGTHGYANGYVADPKTLCGASIGRHIEGVCYKTRRGYNTKDKSNTLLTSNQFMKYQYPTFRKFTPVECERLQTVPDNYTDCVSNSQRYKMLGNGWTVDVITHIFKNIDL